MTADMQPHFRALIPTVLLALQVIIIEWQQLLFVIPAVIELVMRLKDILRTGQY